MADKGVTGDLKVWIAGHSRSAAVSALTAGFLVDEGGAFLGRGVSLEPDDVFAYCSATPTHIVRGASVDEVLSVSAARTDPSYAARDTPGAAYTHTGGGTIHPSSGRYRGIRNYIADTDIVPLAPPSDWGFMRYGVDVACDAGGKVTLDDMAEQLRRIDQGYYEQFVAGADPRRLTWVSLDPARIGLDHPTIDASVMRPTPDAGDGSAGAPDS